MSIYTGAMNSYFLFSLRTLERIGRWRTETGRTRRRDTMWLRQVMAAPSALKYSHGSPHTRWSVRLAAVSWRERVVSSTSRNGWCILKKREALNIYNSLSWTNIPERKWGQKSKRMRIPNQGQPRNSRTIVFLTHSSFLSWVLTASFTRWLNS